MKCKVDEKEGKISLEKNARDEKIRTVLDRFHDSSKVNALC